MMRPILALATLEMVLMVFRMEFFPANPSPVVTRDPPAKPARGPSSGASLKRALSGLLGAGAGAGEGMAEHTRRRRREVRDVTV